MVVSDACIEAEREQLRVGSGKREGGGCCGILVFWCCSVRGMKSWRDEELKRGREEELKERIS